MFGICNIFKNSAAPQTEGEKFLSARGLRYKKRHDGMIVVYGSIDLRNRKLLRLPDLSNCIVKGSFDCSWNELGTLTGAPRDVTGSFSCDWNKLTSLKDGPQSVGGTFDCEDNRLITLEGAPQKFKSIQSDFGRFSPGDLELATAAMPAPAQPAPANASPPAADEDVSLRARIRLCNPLKLKSTGG